MQVDKTVFERIWDGAAPSFPIFRSDKHGIQVILDIYPAQPGHVLVIPREAVDHISDLDAHRYLQVSAVIQAAASHIKNIMEPERVIHVVSGYDIPHVHVHLLPSFRRGDIEESLLSGREGVRASDDSLREMQQTLAFPEKLACETEAQLDRIAESYVKTNVSPITPPKAQNLVR